MNESTIAGKFDELKGKVKQGVGEAFGDEKLANSGAADEVKGTAKETWGNTKDAFNNATTGAKSNAQADEERISADAHQGAANFRDKVTSGAHKVEDAVTGALHNFENKR